MKQEQRINESDIPSLDIARKMIGKAALPESLKTKSLINYVSGDKIELTDAGRSAADFPDTALTSETLQGMVFGRLPGPESKILREIIHVWPGTISNQECAERTGYANGGGAYNNPRGRLKSLGLIEYPSPGHLRARDILFPDRISR